MVIPVLLLLPRVFSQTISLKHSRAGPLFLISEDPTDPIDRPCLKIDCPISAVHNRGRYHYLGQPVPEFLKDDLEKELGEGAREFWGLSNPHPLVWQAVWMGEMAPLLVHSGESMFRRIRRRTQERFRTVSVLPVVVLEETSYVSHRWNER